MSAAQPLTPTPQPLTLHLAQISDLHLSHNATGNGLVLQGETAGLLRGAVAQLQARTDLDAVLVTGDLTDDGQPAQLDAVIDELNALPVPWYAIPGNHDDAFPPGFGHLDRAGFYVALQTRAPRGAAVYAGAAERGSWTTLIKPGVRLVGLDSNITGDWAGEVDAAQLAWLDSTLAAATEPLIVLLVHHPLHQVLGGWQEPTFNGQPWGKFFCTNGAEVQSVLDRYPAVRLVLTGHVHLARVDQLGGRLHLSAPALSTYPLAYCTIQIAEEAGGWLGAWQTHSPADAALREQARRQVEDNGISRAFDPADPARFSAVSAGRPEDQQGTRRLPPTPAGHA